MRARQLDLEHDGILRDMAVLHLDVKVGRRAQQRLVVGADPLETLVVLGPRRVVIESAGAERRHETVEIVRVLASDVFLDLPEATSCRRVHGCSHPLLCACPTRNTTRVTVGRPSASARFNRLNQPAGSAPASLGPQHARRRLLDGPAASPEPALIHTKPTAVPGVNGSPSNVTPARSAMAGFT